MATVSENIRDIVHGLFQDLVVHSDPHAQDLHCSGLRPGQFIATCLCFLLGGGLLVLAQSFWGLLVASSAQTIYPPSEPISTKKDSLGSYEGTMPKQHLVQSQLLSMEDMGSLGMDSHDAAQVAKSPMNSIADTDMGDSVDLALSQDSADTNYDPYGDSEPEEAYAVSQRLSDRLHGWSQHRRMQGREHYELMAMEARRITESPLHEQQTATHSPPHQSVRKARSFADMTISASLKCRNADLSLDQICRRRSSTLRPASEFMLCDESTTDMKSVALGSLLSPSQTPLRRSISHHTQQEEQQCELRQSMDHCICMQSGSRHCRYESLGQHLRPCPSGREATVVVSATVETAATTIRGTLPDTLSTDYRSDSSCKKGPSCCSTLCDSRSNLHSQSVRPARHHRKSCSALPSSASDSFSSPVVYHSQTPKPIKAAAQQSSHKESLKAVNSPQSNSNPSAFQTISTDTSPCSSSPRHRSNLRASLLALSPKSLTRGPTRSYSQPSLRRNNSKSSLYPASIKPLSSTLALNMNSSAGPKESRAGKSSPAVSSTALAHHKGLAEQAYRSISSGLDEEQLNGNLEAALQLYRHGIRDMQLALKIIFTTEAERNKAAPLNVKMKSNMVQIQERARNLAVSVSDLRVARSRQNEKPISPRTSQSNSRPSPSATPATNSSAVSRHSKFESSESKAMAHLILNEIIVNKPNVLWEDIVGLDAAKRALREIVVLPNLRPELFTGLRAPARGVLLFGPPGTGKTMLAKAVANESKATFFSISASTLTSKYFGEGEKMVRSLFEMAKQLQPSVIFVDEIDSILTERSESEHEASRRLKTEFLLQFDGIGSSSDDRVLVLAASNRPQELDEAALRRLVKRIYIPLPEASTRSALIKHLLGNHKHSLTDSDIRRLVGASAGYSGSDLTAVAREASLGPIRSLGDKLLSTPTEDIRGITLADFTQALKIIRPSVSLSTLQIFESWNQEKGTAGA
ncbi:hypothetical protein BASA50_006077 [Batrachochytrium salamandrivorans]|uniref:microtubule-severing ATPase n=1 Tax=Batrachochytrium salamandrivorans TaxID=1357716 RepID=A0ABQ8FDZ8_9FUNG|nr:hypothetical protein BASA50_006077 [Batrachochytrium salamandrivorans]KAH9252541.1 hypothetical protein BASA81_009500 [Batrachochytrium salamandrivorans]KAH9274367.1 hypothetical protein BASA83_003365 [Batrachochytrium salamandrivorans]